MFQLFLPFFAHSFPLKKPPLTKETDDNSVGESQSLPFLFLSSPISLHPKYVKTWRFVVEFREFEWKTDVVRDAGHFFRRNPSTTGKKKRERGWGGEEVYSVHSAGNLLNGFWNSKRNTDGLFPLRPSSFPPLIHSVQCFTTPYHSVDNLLCFISIFSTCHCNMILSAYFLL